MARRVITSLGIGTSATHMEWFFGAKGLKFSEIGCRPPASASGTCMRRRTSSTSIVNGRWRWCTAASASSHRAATLRHDRAAPNRDGRITGYEGVERIVRDYGECIVGAHLPQPGTPTQPVEAGYMANAWMRVRHPDYDELRGILNRIGETVKVFAN